MDRTIGRSIFGQNLTQYQSARPPYPAELYQSLRQYVGAAALGPAFEIGAGSGQASTELLHAGFSPLQAIEPDPILAARLQQHLDEAIADNRLQVQCSTFEEADLDSHQFAFGCAATAFHWLEPAAAMARIRRALRPGGTWAMWWNVFGDPEQPDDFWHASQALFQSLGQRGSSPSFDTKQRRPYALNTQARQHDLKAAGFVDIQAQRWSWTHRQSAAEVVALTSTFSAVASLPTPQCEDFLRRIEALVIEQFGGWVERRFVTALYLATSPQSSQ